MHSRYIPILDWFSTLIFTQHTSIGILVCIGMYCAHIQHVLCSDTSQSQQIYQYILRCIIHTLFPIQTNTREYVQIHANTYHTYQCQCNTGQYCQILINADTSRQIPTNTYNTYHYLPIHTMIQIQTSTFQYIPFIQYRSRQINTYKYMQMHTNFSIHTNAYQYRSVLSKTYQYRHMQINTNQQV